MDCEEVREVLLCGGDDKADDGARSLEEVRAGVERHLAECAGCRSLAAAAESFRAWMIGRGRAFEPPGFQERLVAAAVAETAGTVPARERTPRGGEGPGGAARRGLRAMAMAAAASAALAVGAWAALHAWISSREGAREGVAGESCWCFVNGDGGNSRNAGEAAEEMRRILWRAEVPGMAGAYKPLAWRNYIIVGSVETAWNEGCRFVAFDAETGAKRWECTFHEGDFYKGRDFPDRCIVDGVLYASDGRRCVAVDARTGAFLKAYRPPVGASGWT
ncbi:MAG: hypothetical protein N3A38_11595, partial [Planctomycetota bacterium]|nr:hypothetical protein [Planctomycetota bacterium]